MLLLVFHHSLLCCVVLHIGAHWQFVCHSAVMRHVIERMVTHKKQVSCWLCSKNKMKTQNICKLYNTVLTVAWETYTLDCIEIMPLELLCHWQINKYLLDYINNFMSLSYKNVTRLLSVKVWWVVILVHEVASFVRFNAASLDGWFPTFQRIIVISTSGWSSPRHYNSFGGGGKHWWGWILQCHLPQGFCLGEHCCENFRRTFCCIFGRAWVQVSTAT